MTRLQQLRQARSDRIKQALDEHRLRVAHCCPGCGIAYADGYTIGCDTCTDRACSVRRRVRENQRVNPNLLALARAYKHDCDMERLGHGGRYVSMQREAQVA